MSELLVTLGCEGCSPERKTYRVADLMKPMFVEILNRLSVPVTIRPSQLPDVDKLKILDPGLIKLSLDCHVAITECPYYQKIVALEAALDTISGEVSGSVLGSFHQTEQPYN